MTGAKAAYGLMNEDDPGVIPVAPLALDERIVGSSSAMLGLFVLSINCPKAGAVNIATAAATVFVFDIVR